MLIRLLRDARVHHKAGEIIDVTAPAELNHLLTTHSAEPLRTAAGEAGEKIQSSDGDSATLREAGKAAPQGRSSRKAKKST